MSDTIIAALLAASVGLCSSAIALAGALLGFLASGWQTGRQLKAQRELEEARRQWAIEDENRKRAAAVIELHCAEADSFIATIQAEVDRLDGWAMTIFMEPDVNEKEAARRNLREWAGNRSELFDVEDRALGLDRDPVTWEVFHSLKTQTHFLAKTFETFANSAPSEQSAMRSEVVAVVFEWRDDITHARVLIDRMRMGLVDYTPTP